MNADGMRPEPGRSRTGWQGDWPPPSRPRRVEGGLKARSKRGAIGEQWWSRRFLAVLESFGMTSRLARGRNYARTGQVLGFELAPGRVTARVQGSRPAPYRVSIKVRPLNAAQWERVEAALAARALFRAKLLAGEMPAEIEEVFAECGTPLFPEAAGDLEMSCSCPDWGMPCKHLAAVCYLLAETFDADPFAMLAWRGRGREELLTRLRGLAAREPGGAAREPGGAAREPGGAAPGAGEAAPGVGGTAPGVGGTVAEAGGAVWEPGGTVAEAGGAVPGVGGAVIEGSDRPLAECLDDFFSAGLPAARLRTLPVAQTGPPDLLLRAFPPPDVRVRGRDLADVLATAYERIAAGPESPWRISVT